MFPVATVAFEDWLTDRLTKLIDQPSDRPTDPCFSVRGSTDAALKGAPKGHTVTVREIRAAVGAGFLYMICGDIMTVPGLPTRPGFYDVDIDFDTGKIVGLF